MIISIAVAAAMLAPPATSEAPAPIIIRRSPLTPPPPLPTPIPVNAEAFAAARELLLSMDFNSQMDRTAHQVTESTFKTVMDAEERAAGIAFPEDLKQTIRQLVLRHNEQVLADMKAIALDEAARVYAKYFTAAEIRELQRLQSNPVLTKMRTLAPQLTSDLMQIGVRQATARMPELSTEIKAAIRDWLAKHSETIPHHS